MTVNKKRLGILVAVIIVLILPMIACDFAAAHFLGKEITPLTMGGNLIYAFFVLKPLVNWLAAKI